MDSLLKRSWSFVSVYLWRRECEGVARRWRSESRKASHEKETRLYSIDASYDAIASFKSYIAKLSPKCTSFFQKPWSMAALHEDIWYENRPLSVNKLWDRMRSIFIEQNSQVFTQTTRLERWPHCPTLTSQIATLLLCSATATSKSLLVVDHDRPHHN